MQKNIFSFRSELFQKSAHFLFIFLKSFLTANITIFSSFQLLCRRGGRENWIFQEKRRERIIFSQVKIGPTARLLWSVQERSNPPQYRDVLNSIKRSTYLNKEKYSHQYRECTHLNNEKYPTQWREVLYWITRNTHLNC